MKRSMLLGSILVCAGLLFGCQSNDIDMDNLSNISSSESTTGTSMSLSDYESMAKKMVASINDSVNVTSKSEKDSNSIMVLMDMGDVFKTKGDYYVFDEIKDMDSSISTLTENVGDALWKSGFDGIVYIAISTKNGDVATCFGYNVQKNTIAKIQ